MRRSINRLLLSLACSVALAAQAQAVSGPINVPAGDLSSALNTLARQSGTQLVYHAAQLRGMQTPGVQGATSTSQALETLLQGSGFAATRDPDSGALLIAQADADETEVAPAQPSAAADDTPVTQMKTLQVTGSRIPRAQIEGPAPVSVITAAEI